MTIRDFLRRLLRGFTPMNRIKRYYPNFCEGFPDEEATFGGVGELLAVDFVKSWSQHEGFHRYSQYAYAGQTKLLAEFDGGARWHVVGMLDAPLPDGELPHWKAPEKETST